MHNFGPWELEDSASPILETGNQAILASAALPHGNTLWMYSSKGPFK